MEIAVDVNASPVGSIKDQNMEIKRRFERRLVETSQAVEFGILQPILGELVVCKGLRT
jgi:hypothetical protein